MITSAYPTSHLFAFTIAASALVACEMPIDDPVPDEPDIDDASADDTAIAESDLTGPDIAADAAVPGELPIGYTVGFASTFANPHFDALWSTTSHAPHRRMCHAYPAWNVAQQQPGEKGNGNRANFQAIHDAALRDHCELLVSFKTTNDALPHVDQYARAIDAFKATWPTVHLFTAWNEPNNDHPTGNGLSPPKTMGAQLAADYYLALRQRCRPIDGCLVAAGDIVGWASASAFAMTCPGRPENGCPQGSFLDRYKHRVATAATAFGLPGGFHPEFFALHPWFDSFQYMQHRSHCTSTDDCVTRAALASLSGSWSRARIWITEVGVNHDGRAVRRSDDVAQACGAAFLMRLFESEPRITRFYYSHFCGPGANGDSGLVSPGSGGNCQQGTSVRKALTALRDRDSRIAGCW